tara:strand:+ start:1532 stop:2830 length:1299 start_codon:yes stop_codon:yes gene_type:complete
MSTLKVNKLRDTSGSTDAITLDPNGGAVLAGVTTISTARITTGITTSIQVGGGVTISESGIEASGIGITCANINGTQIGGRRNIVINGAMEVAQRGTSFTLATGFAADRFKVQSGGLDEVVTASNLSLSTSTSPAGDLFRNAARMTNGNQTSGAQAGSYVQMAYQVEARDMANSGWQYASSSSFITLSFYVRSSVAQTFYGWVNTVDGTGQRWTFDIPVTQADTWTRIIKKIPGNSNLTFDNNAGQGLQLLFVPFYGTNYTDDKALNSWAASDGANYCPDMTTTWFTTNDSTFDVTGVQIEVGPEATPFEHRSFGEELALCQRYYYKMQNGSSSAYWVAPVTAYGSSTNVAMIFLPVCMRDNPSLGTSTTASDFSLWGAGTVENLASVPTLRGHNSINPQVIPIDISHNITTGHSRILRMGNEAFLEFSSEF